MSVTEVIVADGSSNQETEAVINEVQWRRVGLVVRHLRVQPPNAVRQREDAIRESTGELLLLLDDDVVLEPDCVEQLAQSISIGPEIVAVSATYRNQSWPQPTKPWRLYMKYVLGFKEGEWQGRVIGPLLRFGYYSTMQEYQLMEWIGTGKSLIRRKAFYGVGGFSKFFLHRCTMNEDVDLGLKLSQVGKILFCPSAFLNHYHAPEGRVSAITAAEDDLYNRFQVLYRTLKYSFLKSLKLILIFLLVETVSDMWGILRLNNPSMRLKNSIGRFLGMGSVILSLIFEIKSEKGYAS